MMKKRTKGCVFPKQFKNYSPGDGKSTGERAWRVAYSPGDFEFT